MLHLVLKSLCEEKTGLLYGIGVARCCLFGSRLSNNLGAAGRPTIFGEYTLADEYGTSMHSLTLRRSTVEAR